MSLPLLLLLILFLLFFTPSLSSTKSHNLSSFSISQSPWHPNQNLILLSPNSLFAAGFLPLSNNSNLFIFSIWFLNNISIDNVVWSANRRSPVTPTAALTITSSGELRLIDGSGHNIWPWKNVSGNTNSTKLILRDDGNLIYNSWESFQFPTNTILANQTLNNTTMISNNGRYEFTESLNLTYNSTTYWSAGNSFKMLQNDGRVLKNNQDSIITSDFNSTQIRKLVLDDDGNLRIYSYNPNFHHWSIVWRALQELCQIYSTCGINSICMNSENYNSTTYCICPPGFFPDSVGGARRGCHRKFKIAEKVKFLSMDFVSFRGGVREINLKVQNISECEGNCLRNSSCVGFRFSFDGSGDCLLQLDILSNMYWSPGLKMATFVKVDESESDQSNFTGMMYKFQTTCPIHVSLRPPPESTDNTTRNVLIICTIFAAELVSGAVFFCAFLKRFMKYRDMARTLGLESLPAGGPKRFTYGELKIATDDFSNSIGRGGFGEVYKGELVDKRVVAVKRLRNVAGGDADFWAEVTIIARMHHLNLVRLWGFCAEKNQRILVYEYIPNGSLDNYLFKSYRSENQDGESEIESDENPSFNWSVRYRIAIGVARAIAYLHEECLEWVLHRDIKPENILLDGDFCPKLSDFGLSKLRKKEETVVTMSRVGGTPGYVAPEMVKSGLNSITTKADVYSFGKVLLEIISGVRNSVFERSTVESVDWHFPSWAYDKVFVEDNVEEILDRRIKNQYDSGVHFDMVNRMVQTAIWCLQDQPEMRPAMGKVVKMLEGKVEIPRPEKPSW